MNERERIEQSISALEAQRGSLGDDVVAPAIAALCKQLAELDAASVPSRRAERKPVLGIECVLEQSRIASFSGQLQSDAPHLFIMDWLADYPDPHNFLAQGLTYGSLWQDPSYWDKVRRAASTLDVRKRMALYHELDRQLVVEEALCIPLTYRRNSFVLGPHIRRFFVWPVAYASFKDVVME
jgi:ABC-type oligopeptide transport system substrate-binding subunit